MNAAELMAVVSRLRQQGIDDAHVEVKAGASSLSSDVWESVSAFANTRGGVIIFGLDEKNGFTVVPGFALDKVRHQFVMGIGDGGPDNCVMVNAPQYELERVDFEGRRCLWWSWARRTLGLSPVISGAKDWPTVLTNA